MATPLPDEEGLAPAPADSAWGRLVARGYLVLAALAFVLLLRELLVGRPGPGTMAVSILTAPWSVLLAGLAPLAGRALSPAAVRGLGVALVVVSVLLNARILYGMAARAERDARAARNARGGPTHG